MFVILVADIIWLFGHAKRSSSLLDFSFLHYCSHNVATTLPQRCDMIVLAARLMETLFGRQIVLLMHKKNGQGELARRWNRLFLIFNTAISQKMQNFVS